MTFSIRILPRAERDAQSIFKYLAQHSPEGAVRWWDAFEKATRELGQDPFRYGLAAESGIFDYELRQFLFKTRRGRTYRGVFVVVGDEVRLLRVRGPGHSPLEADELPGTSS